MISGKLPQKLKVIFEKQAQIVHAIQEHRKTLHAETEGKTTVPLAIDAHVGKDIGVNHAAPQNLEPSTQAMRGG